MSRSGTLKEETLCVSSLALAATIAAPVFGGNSSINSSLSTHALSGDELLESTMATGDDHENSSAISSSEGDSSSQASDQTIRPSAKVNRLKTYCIDPYDQRILEGFEKELREFDTSEHTAIDSRSFLDRTEDETWTCTRDTSKFTDSLDYADDEDIIKPKRPTTRISSRFKILLNRWNDNSSRLTVWMDVGFVMQNSGGDIRDMITGVGPFEEDIWLLQTPTVPSDQLETALERAWQEFNLTDPVLRPLASQAKLEEIKLELFRAKQTTKSPRAPTQDFEMNDLFY